MSTTEFLFACLNNKVELVKHMITKVDPSVNNNIAIMRASENGRLELVKILLSDPRVEPSGIHNFAIRYAAKNGHLEMVRLLMQDPRVNPADDDNFAIRWASLNGYLDIVALLLQDPRVDPNNAFSRKYYTVIECANLYGHTEIADLLTQHQYKMDNSKYLSLAEKLAR